MDRYGCLDRVPPPPRRGILVMLARATATAAAQANRLVVWRERLAKTEQKIPETTTYADRMVLLRLADRTKKSIARLTATHTYTYRRLVSLLDATKTRTRENRIAKKLVGVDVIDDRIARAQVVVDVLSVRLACAGDSLAILHRDDAFKRLHKAAEKSAMGLRWAAIRRGRLATDEIDERIILAVYRAAEQWSWTGRAAFPSYSFDKIKRELETRSKWERPLLEHTLPSGACVSSTPLSALSACGDGGRDFEPVMARASNVGDHVVVQATTLRAETTERDGAGRDVAAALATLSDEDRGYATAMWIEGCTIKETAARLGVSTRVVMTKRAKIGNFLRETLAAYDPEGEL